MSRPPPLDAECAAARVALPQLPALEPGTIGAFRAALAASAPGDAELAGHGAFTISERAVPGLQPGDPAVTLLACLPRSATPVPVLYYVHGGGMVSGTSRHGLPEIMRLATALGAAVVSVEYRLAPETPDPGPLHDCYAGLLGMLASAADFGIDPDRVVLVGRSAGGGLAAGVALLCRDRRGPAVLGQLLIYPMLDDRDNTPSTYQLAGLPTWNRTANQVGWGALLGTARGGPDVSPYAAPARADDLAGLPPTYVDVGSCDTFRDEDVTFAGRIWAAGGAAELHVWPGGFHGFDGVAPEAALSRGAFDARLGWLRRLLG